jgi:cysteine desulfurase
MECEAARLAKLRDRLWERLDAALDGLVRNGHPTRRLPGNLNVSFEGVDGERLLLALQDIAVSSGSACTSADPEPSHVLAALGRSPALARASLRFGLGRGTSEADIERAADRVIEEVKGLRDGRPGPR